MLDDLRKELDGMLHPQLTENQLKAKEFADNYVVQVNEEKQSETGGEQVDKVEEKDTKSKSKVSKKKKGE